MSILLFCTLSTLGHLHEQHKNSRVHLFCDTGRSQKLKIGYGHWILCNANGVILSQGSSQMPAPTNDFHTLDATNFRAGFYAALQLDLKVTDVWFDGVTLIPTVLSFGLVPHRVVKDRPIVGVDLCHLECALAKQLAHDEPYFVMLSRISLSILRGKCIFDPS